MSQSNEYTAIKKCFTCLEHFLLFTDFGFSEATASFLAGVYHVSESKTEFAELAQHFLREQTRRRIKP